MRPRTGGVSGRSSVPETWRRVWGSAVPLSQIRCIWDCWDSNRMSSLGMSGRRCLGLLAWRRAGPDGFRSAPRGARHGLELDHLHPHPQPEGSGLGRDSMGLIAATLMLETATARSPAS